jgi:hypothetical protein
MRLEHLKTHRMIHTGEKPFQVIYMKNKALFLIQNGTGPHWTLTLEYMYRTELKFGKMNIARFESLITLEDLRRIKFFIACPIEYVKFSTDFFYHL